MGRNSNSGCGALLISLVVIFVALWAINIVLWIVAVAVPIVAMYFASRFFSQAAAQKEMESSRTAIAGELAELAQDASYDLLETINKWDALVMTKGIGTAMEGRDTEAREFQRRLWAAKDALDAASTPRQQAEAVNQADELRMMARKYL